MGQTKDGHNSNKNRLLLKFKTNLSEDFMKRLKVLEEQLLIDINEKCQQS
jgi:hypothetical protein